MTEEFKKLITDFVRSRDHNYQVVDINFIIDMDSTNYYYRVTVTVKRFHKIGKFTNTSYIIVNENELKQFERDRYTIKVELPFIRVIGDDKSIYYFCTLTHQEISFRYNITLKKGKVPFRYTTYLFEEYFEYKDVIRNNKLNELGI